MNSLLQLVCFLRSDDIILPIFAVLTNAEGRHFHFLMRNAFDQEEVFLSRDLHLCVFAADFIQKKIISTVCVFPGFEPMAFCAANPVPHHYVVNLFR